MNKLLRFIKSLAFKTLAPIVIVILILVTILATYLATTIKNASENFLIQNALLPEFSLLANEKDSEFNTIKTLTLYTTQKIQEKILASEANNYKNADTIFNTYISKLPDGSYRSKVDASRGRFQMVSFNSKRREPTIQDKALVADAYTYFYPFLEATNNVVHDSYFTTHNSIWQYGFTDWVTGIRPDEVFEQYNWYYDADPRHDPQRKQVWTDIYYDDYQHEWMVSSLAPVYVHNQFFGVFGQDFILRDIISFTKRNALGKTGNLFFIDNLDNIVAHPDTVSVLRKRAANDARFDIKSLTDKPLTSALQHLPKTIGYRLTQERNRRIVMYFPLKVINWKMVYVVNEADFLRIVTQTNQQYIVIFILFALFILALIVFVIRRGVTRPINQLIEAAVEISQGNLDKQIPAHSGDEIGVLAATFNDMSSKLKSSYSILEEKVRERTSELERLKAGLEQTVTERAKMMEEKTKLLEGKMAELERMNKLMTDRELKMVELKKKLEGKNGESNNGE